MNNKCRCQSEGHGHKAGACQGRAVTADHLCKPCHDDKAAAEGMGWYMPLSEPLRPFFAAPRGGITKIREYYEVHPVQLFIILALTVAGSLTGFVFPGWWAPVVASLVLGRACLYFNARTKHRDTERQ